MNNPQTPNRPQSSQHKPEPNARISNQQSKNRGPNNKNFLNSDTTTQYENGKGKMENDQRENMLRENHQKTQEKKRDNGSKMNKEEV